MLIFGVTVVLYFVKILSGSRNNLVKLFSILKKFLVILKRNQIFLRRLIWILDRFREHDAMSNARFPLGEFVRANRQKSRNASYLFAANFFASQF